MRLKKLAGAGNITHSATDCFSRVFLAGNFARGHTLERITCCKLFTELRNVLLYQVNNIVSDVVQP